MGSFSIWHWIILLVFICIPLIFAFTPPPPGPNRFGPPPSSMGFGEAIGSFFKNYVNFKGRAARSEYWFAFLFMVLSSVVLGVIDPTKVISNIWSIAIFLPSIAVAARRLHDINRSGWYQLLSCLVPVGSIIMICWYCMKGRDDGGFAAQRSNSAATRDSVEILEKLAKLRESGAITAGEYEAEKKKILGS